MQTSAMKTCFQIAECSFAYAKVMLFLGTKKLLGKFFVRNLEMDLFGP